ncbi:MAG: neuromedin U [Bacteroidota bacterium]|nr:neuromedin U [Bacteroidota bacterium]
MINQTKLVIGLIAFVMLFLTATAYGQESQESDAAALAKATQNPVAAMYSLPFQNNTTYGYGPYNRAQNILNIQPVLPFSLGDKVNLINRIILPIITQPSSSEDLSTTGTGDINWTAFLSPSKAGKIIWGIGPALQIPTSSSREFGSGEFGMGPSLVALTMIESWVVGIVTNNVWTFGDIAENKFLFQYFINYNLPKAWYIVSAPIMTANWNADSDQRWIVPFGGGVGKVFKVGKLPLNFNAQIYYNAVKPDGVGNVQSRFQLQFLFPKK